ncbi:MAG: hypothetical protein ABIJ10_00505 [Candidatus Micrarchaeota archaeon]|nr:hypothetical protein [Candidatus Micrarchaeota archaeon]MBU1887254.1 hypothetical protein [Candidatus Micrarchaeota archaeon]
MATAPLLRSRTTEICNLLAETDNGARLAKLPKGLKEGLMKKHLDGQSITLREPHLLTRIANNIFSSKRFQEALDGLERHGLMNWKGIRQLMRVKMRAHRLDCLEEKSSHIEVVEQHFKLFLKALEIAQNSNNPDAYMNFMARDGFQLTDFIDWSDVFVSRTQLHFKRVGETQNQDGEQIIALINNGSDEAMLKLLAIVYEKLSKRFTTEKRERILAMAFDIMARHLLKDSENFYKLFKENEPDVYKWRYKHLRELDRQKLSPTTIVGLFFEDGICTKSPVDFPVQFDQFITVGNCGIFILKNQLDLGNKTSGGSTDLCFQNIFLPPNYRERSKQHEIQHSMNELVMFYNKVKEIFGEIFTDHEYLAKLAELIFVFDPEDIRISFDLFRKSAKRTLEVRPQSYAHVYSSQRVLQELGHLEFDHESLRSAALERLDEYYKKECNLTYTEILEPLKFQMR